MIITNRDILLLYETINSLEKEPKIAFTIKVSYALAKNKKIIEPDVEVIEQLRKNIFLEFGKPNENGDIIIPWDKSEEMNKKLEELMSIESEKDLILISLDEMIDSEEKIDVKTMSGLLIIEKNPGD